MASNNDGWTDPKPYHEVVDNQAPDLPGVYKISWRDSTKEYYDGQSENLRKRLYGHPYHDSDVGNFIATHMNSKKCPPMVSFKVTSSPEAARVEEKKLLQEHEAKYSELPKFNQNM